jgi:hypothetical protein
VQEAPEAERRKAEHRHQHGVAVRDMGELVRENGLELLGLEALDQAARHDDHAAAPAAARGERVGNRALRHRDARLGEIGSRAESGDCLGEQGVVARIDDARRDRGQDGALCEFQHGQRDADRGHDDESPSQRRGNENEHARGAEDKRRVDDEQDDRREHHANAQPEIAGVADALHPRLPPRSSLKGR